MRTAWACSWILSFYWHFVDAYRVHVLPQKVQIHFIISQLEIWPLLLLLLLILLTCSAIYTFTVVGVVLSYTYCRWGCFALHAVTVVWVIWAYIHGFLEVVLVYSFYRWGDLGLHLLSLGVVSTYTHCHWGLHSMWLRVVWAYIFMYFVSTVSNQRRQLSNDL